MTPEERARKIVMDWMQKPRATIECDLFIPIVVAIKEAEANAHKGFIGRLMVFVKDELMRVAEKIEVGDWIEDKRKGKRT